MICQQCETRPATLHFTKIINGEKTEMHVCEQCASENGDAFSFSNQQGFSINNLLAGLLNLDPAVTENYKQQSQEVLSCPTCGMTYQRFAKIGRFGCADCYKTFERPLIPFLKRLHGGNYLHHGKIPARIASNLHLKKELQALRLNLKEYIEKEEFEKAAELRDHIRLLEKKMNESREEEA
ncbi:MULTISPECIES: UvrB/UvrC motif-containing protein [Priestia]|uniref:UvrB/UvrC motif-containing protein n=1 Tax=Priestia TaxID=2800373 RepID=UPI0005EC1A3C|nr:MULTISPECIES: UvrB/UvrC motif-containing protein [Priestia]KJL03015.1 hypothetical protein N178_20315 [Priestia aryabhattai B8W22]MBX4163985.1 UvrB/UvrC motif-containing protein [Priestia megaterium]MED3881030.1 UvrB/UvrC motif-containing protein [Priestia megaterium]MED3897989.1 UvrB/UvrC motif-containing protein [Priestia aryabhattai]